VKFNRHGNTSLQEVRGRETNRGEFTLEEVQRLKEDIERYHRVIKAHNEAKVTSELANVAGKIMKTAVVELDYNRFTKQTNKKIPFLEG